MRAPQDPQHLINCFNKYGQNSVYIAAKNGNYVVLKFLLEAEANIHIKSRVCDRLDESPLEVCARWNHFECARLLLSTK